MKRSLLRSLLACAAIFYSCYPANAQVVTLGPSWQANAGGVNYATLTGNTASGYDYVGIGAGASTDVGLDGIAGSDDDDFPSNGSSATLTKDTRTRPKIYNTFSSVDLSAVGSSLSLTYDILWHGTERPSNESQDWRFGFGNSTANGGRGVTLGANLDIGNMAGTAKYEFYTDPDIQPLGSVGVGEMDFAFTSTQSDDVPGPGQRVAQSGVDPYDNGGPDVTTNPFKNIIGFNDTTDTHRLTFTITRIVDGYDLDLRWENLSQDSADYNNDGTVDSADFTVWLDSLGDSPALADDFEGNPRPNVDMLDYEYWVTNFLQGSNAHPTIHHSATITTSDAEAATAFLAGTTTWDRVGFFINDEANRSPTPDEPWQYTMSNISVVQAGGPTVVPEPTCMTYLVALLLCGIVARRQRSRSAS